MGITRVLLLNCHLFTVPPGPTSLTVGHLGSENENGNQARRGGGLYDDRKHATPVVVVKFKKDVLPYHIKRGQRLKRGCSGDNLECVSIRS